MSDLTPAELLAATEPVGGGMAARITAARAARELGRVWRAGKPTSFRRAVGMPRLAAATSPARRDGHTEGTVSE